MRKWRWGGMAAALLVGLGAAVAAAGGGEFYEDHDKKPEAVGILSGLFNEKPKRSANSGKGAKGAPNAPNAVEPIVKPPPARSVAVEAAEQQRHMNALIRRMEVCDRLRMIANQTGNEALMNQANELEERANRIYRRQIAGLPLPASTPLSILAGDQQNPGRNPPGAMVETAPLRSQLGGMGGNRP